MSQFVDRKWFLSDQWCDDADWVDGGLGPRVNYWPVEPIETFASYVWWRHTFLCERELPFRGCSAVLNGSRQNKKTQNVAEILGYLSSTSFPSEVDQEHEIIAKIINPLYLQHLRKGALTGLAQDAVLMEQGTTPVQLICHFLNFFKINEEIKFYVFLIWVCGGGVVIFSRVEDEKWIGTYQIGPWLKCILGVCVWLDILRKLLNFWFFRWPWVLE